MAIEALPTPQPVDVAIVDDYPLITEGLRRQLGREHCHVRLTERSIDEPPTARVDVSLLDMHGPNPVEPSALAHFLADPRNGTVLLYSWPHSDNDEADARRLGFAGFLSKASEASDLINAIERAAAGHLDDASAHWPGQEAGLSLREWQILDLIASGLRNEDICGRLFLSINTVKTYIRNAYRRIGVARRSQAVVWVSTYGHRTTPSFATRPA